jgi:hypothetical protein
MDLTKLNLGFLKRFCRGIYVTDKLKNPLHSIIRTMTERSDFKNDLAWIQSKLSFKVSQDVSQREFSGFSKADNSL